MPYIKREHRDEYDKELEILIYRLRTRGSKAGEINYVISSIVTTIFQTDKCYETANKIQGVLDCVSKEHYRKHIAPYEEEKEKENGPII